MYILNWNPSVRQVEASFGGAVTAAEAEVFLEDFRALVVSDDVRDFDLLIDYAKVSRMDDGIREVLDSAREMAQFSGARKVTVVARDEADAESWTNVRLQQVLEGTEEYVAFGLAA